MPQYVLKEMRYPFNSLPVEIIKEIFCDVGCPDLFDVKLVCSFWRTIIEDILNIQEIQVSAERYSNAVNVVEIDSGIQTCALQICQAPCRIRNLITEKILYDQIGQGINRLVNIRLTNVFNILEDTIREYHSVHEPTGITFRHIMESSCLTLIAMTGIECSVASLRSKSSKEREKLMAKYTWYTFTAQLAVDNWKHGIIALYPDSRTFAIFYGFWYNGHFDYELVWDA